MCTGSQASWESSELSDCIHRVGVYFTIYHRLLDSLVYELFVQVYKYIIYIIYTYIYIMYTYICVQDWEKGYGGIYVFVVGSVAAARSTMQ